MAAKRPIERPRRLDADGLHHIFVQGDCIDSVHISQRNGVTIEAEGGGASISPPNVMNPFAVAIDSARGITFINIHFTNINNVSNANGIFVDNNSAVQIANSTIDGSVSDGITVSGQSLLRLDDTTIQNNDANGLTVQIGSTVQLGGGVAMNIINNGGNGIELTQGTLHVSGLLTVDSNGGNGLVLGVGSRATIDTDTGPNTFSNNYIHGVAVRVGSTIEFAGDNTIANNAFHGLVVIEGGTARVSNGSTVIMGNSRWGVFAILDSGVRFNGPHQIQLNGNPNSGNGITEFSCDDTSLAFGDLTGIAVNTCKQVEKEKKAQ